MNTHDTLWLTQEQALAFLGVSRPTLYRWIRGGKVPAHRAGRALRFRQDELEAFLHGPPASDHFDDISAAIAFFEERAARRQTQRRKKP